MDWILNHMELVGAVIAFLMAGWKAKNAGTLNRFLVQKVEGLATKEDKAEIRTQAAVVGVGALLSRTVANAGLSSARKPAGLAKKLLQTALPALLVASLSGCASLDSAYRESYIRFGETGAAVRPFLKDPPDASVKALYDAFDANIAEALRAREAR